MNIKMLATTLLFSCSLYAECPRDSTVRHIFNYIETGALVNIDGQVWEVEHVKSTLHFLDGEPKVVHGTSDTFDNQGRDCSYDAYDRMGNKKSITMGSRYKLKF